MSESHSGIDKSEIYASNVREVNHAQIAKWEDFREYDWKEM